MPFAFIIVGIVMLISGSLGNSGKLTKLLKGDLVGQGSFIYWILSILVIGSLGYIEDFKALSRSLLALIIIVLLITEDNKGSGGFFSEFQQAIQGITSSASNSSLTQTASLTTPSSTSTLGPNGLTVPDVLGGTTYAPGTTIYSLPNSSLPTAANNYQVPGGTVTAVPSIVP